jgi:hypothetical protein
MRALAALIVLVVILCVAVLIYASVRGVAHRRRRAALRAATWKPVVVVRDGRDVIYLQLIADDDTVLEEREFRLADDPHPNLGDDAVLTHVWGLALNRCAILNLTREH